MVGGIAALIGAIMLGPRIGKYVKDKKTGKKSARAISGHSITLGVLGVQFIGVAAVAAWTIVCMKIVFFIIKKTVGLRVSAEEEIGGLDAYEHGLASAYADFIPSIDHTYDGIDTVAEGVVPCEQAVPVEFVTHAGIASDVKMTKIEILCKETRFEALKKAMNGIGVPA